MNAKTSGSLPVAWAPISGSDEDLPGACFRESDLGSRIGHGLADSMGKEVTSSHLLVVLGIQFPTTQGFKRGGFCEDTVDSVRRIE